jgi:phage N-6-adenine-methyltransferase
VSPLVGFRAGNHPQQQARRGPQDVLDDRKTPPDLFGALSDRFGGFDLDAAAAPHNALCERFCTLDDSGLETSWGGASVWCNPPYSSIRPWVEKAWSESAAARLIVMLLPANRTDQCWWHDLIEPYRDRVGSPLRTEYIPGRVRFLAPGATTTKPNARPPFGSMLLIWQGGEQDFAGPIVELHHQGVLTPAPDCATVGGSDVLPSPAHEGDD